MKTNWSDLTVADFDYLKSKSLGELELVKFLSENEEPTTNDYIKVTECMGFLNIPPDKILTDTLFINDVEYDVVLDPEKVTASQLIDLLNMQDKELSKFLSVFFIPKGLKYKEGYSVSKLEKTIAESLKMDKAYGFFLFYNHLLEMLLLNTEASLVKKMKKTKKMKKS